MTFVFAAWDNTQVQNADFECQDACPQPAASCDSAKVSFKDVSFKYTGSSWDPQDDGDDNDDGLDKLSN